MAENLRRSLEGDPGSLDGLMARGTAAIAEVGRRFRSEKKRKPYRGAADVQAPGDQSREVNFGILQSQRHRSRNREGVGLE